MAITAPILINHGSINSWWNYLCLAGNVYNWQVQHNVLHHTYTNIPGHDEDLDGRLFVLLKKQNGITFTVFNNIILFFYMDY
jgi:linoleoyl-CoA desaturase